MNRLMANLISAGTQVRLLRLVVLAAVLWPVALVWSAPVARAQSAAPAEAGAVGALRGQLFLDLCFDRGSARFAASVLEAEATRIGDATYAYVLVELFNFGPSAATSALAVHLVDDRGFGDWMDYLPEEAEGEYVARLLAAGALSPIDPVPVGRSVPVLFLFPVAPGARALVLAPHPLCFF